MPQKQYHHKESCEKRSNFSNIDISVKSYFWSRHQQSTEQQNKFSRSFGDDFDAYARARACTRTRTFTQSFVPSIFVKRKDVKKNSSKRNLCHAT